MKNTKTKKILIGLSVITIVAIIGFVLINKTNLFQDDETKLSKRIEEVGADFYENFYYDHISANKTEEELEQFLERFEEVGIKVDLDNLSRFDEEKYSDLTSEFVNTKENITCDIRNTKVIIYPQSPFERTDYKVDHQLDCGFKSSDE